MPEIVAQAAARVKPYSFDALGKVRSLLPPGAR